VDVGEVVMKGGRTVRVQVVDADNGEPLEKAWLRLVAPGAHSDFEGTLEYRPDYGGDYDPVQEALEAEAEHQAWLEAGRAHTLEDVPDQPVELLVEAWEYRVRRVRVEPTQQSLRVELERGARLEGRVFWRGEPVDSGSVRLMTPEGESLELTTIGKEGRYAFAGLEAGRYVVSVWHYVEPPEPLPTYAPREVMVPARGRVQEDFENWQGGCSVEVLPEEPVAQVYLVPGHRSLPDTAGHLRDWTDLGKPGEKAVDGRRRYHDMPAGPYTLVAIQEWHERLISVHAEPLQLPEQGQVTVRLQPRWKVLP
jgi:hypothetical protein